MDANSYVTFLLIGILLVLVDGQILYRGGLGYLRKAYPADSARSVMQLVAVLFHLVVLGFLALISTLDVATGMPIRDLVVKWGVVLLGLAAAHGLTMAILVTMRNRRREEQLEDEIAGDHSGTSAREATVYPVADIETRSGRSSYPA
ncbi:MAG: hypothetical protein DLM62_21135 [Pseudonocardiales bacterium]|nr:MAG: hypothetical protein DLM62_21135 [Pseudonocardiales bacterium]